MINLLRRLICDCQELQPTKRSKYAPERDIDTVQTGGYTPRPITGTHPSPPGKE